MVSTPRLFKPSRANFEVVGFGNKLATNCKNASITARRGEIFFLQINNAVLESNYF